jgi:hypothetical protein
LLASTARSTAFNGRAEICILRSQTHSFSTILHFWLYLPNAEMTLDLEVNEVEVKGLTSLASVTGLTAARGIIEEDLLRSKGGPGLLIGSFPSSNGHHNGSGDLCTP